MSRTAIQPMIKIKHICSYLGFSLILFLNFTITYPLNMMAQGVISVSPKRVVFEGTKKIVEVNLTNEGQDSAKYAISFIQLKMTLDSKFVEITNPDPGQQFADKNIRFYPRSVMLGPNESQIVRLQLNKGNELSPGEYRSHLYFKSLTNQKVLGENGIKKDSTFKLDISPTFGVTIPVIIRVGESTTVLNINDLKMEKTATSSHILYLTINRSGNMSAYGDLKVTYIAPNGKATEISLLNGIAVYTPNTSRIIKVDLYNTTNLDFSKGIIRVLFSSQSEARPQKLAEAELVL